MSLIDLQHVSKIYDLGKVQVPALQDVSLQIEEGDLVAIMGPSGSGKSTLMNVLGLLDRPTSGVYLLDNEKISLSESDRKLAKIRSEKVGFIFQSFNLLPHMSALGNVMMPAIYSDLSRTEANARAKELLVSVGLGDRLDHKPAELSGGEKQRVAIARALINDPEIILADEPTGNLDTVTGNEVLEILKDLNTKGRTIIVITHDEFIADACKRVVYLLDGRVIDESEIGRSSQKEGGRSWWEKMHGIIGKILHSIE